MPDMEEKNNEPVIIRPNLIFLIYKLFIIELLFIGSYLLFDLPVLLLMDGDTTTTKIELQTDWYGLTLLFILSMIQMVVIIIAVLRWFNNYYEIHEHEIIERRDLFSIHENTHSFRNFSAISITQGIIGRIFNFGTIKLYHPLLGHSITMKKISSPLKFERMLKEKLPKGGSENMVINNK